MRTAPASFRCSIKCGISVEFAANANRRAGSVIAMRETTNDMEFRERYVSAKKTCHWLASLPYIALLSMDRRSDRARSSLQVKFTRRVCHSFTSCKLSFVLHDRLALITLTNFSVHMSDKKNTRVFPSRFDPRNKMRRRLSSGGLSSCRAGCAKSSTQPGGISSTSTACFPVQQAKLLSSFGPKKNTKKKCFDLDELLAELAAILTADYYSPAGNSYRSTHRDICSERHAMPRYQPLPSLRYVGGSDTAKESKGGQRMYLRPVSRRTKLCQG